MPRRSARGDERRAAHARRRVDDRHARSARPRYDFRLTQPIPPYLIALAVGDLAFRSLGPRTGVFAEPAVLDAAANEFADLEKMVQAAESIWRAVSLGTLRHARAAAVVPVRRHGESAPHVRDADDPRRRSIADVARRARARAFVVGQPRHQRDVERLLAERRLHRLLRAAHHGSALRRASARRCSKCSAAAS